VGGVLEEKNNVNDPRKRAKKRHKRKLLSVKQRVHCVVAGSVGKKKTLTVCICTQMNMRVFLCEGQQGKKKGGEEKGSNGD
jgi:hypothetical protein